MIQVSDKKLQLKIEEVYTNKQEHIFQFWDALSEQERSNLLTQIEMIDFALLIKLTGQALQPEQKKAIDKLEPPEVISLEQRREKDAVAGQAGEEALAAKKVAAFLVAGGQGTRLGYEGPKGMYPVTPVKNKSLFQLHAEKLLARGRRFNYQIPWYIMTSVTNDYQTRQFFSEHGYFGYKKENIYFFIQDMIPAIDRRGKLIIDRPDHIFMNPNGHGGSIQALWKNKALADMKQRAVEYIFYFQVDNVLTRICDPLYIGYHLLAGSEMSSKVVKKKYPAEKMGVLCKVGRHLHLIEYSDMPEVEMQARNPDGSLKLWAGNIATHIFDRRFLERENIDGFKLPYHIAEKRIPYLDKSGNLLEPTEKNGIKFETFVFDALADARITVCIEVDRSQEFSPLKNNEGENSPQTVKQDLIRIYREWLKAAGQQLPGTGVGEPLTVEISPLLSLQGENLEGADLTIESSKEGIYIEK
jgi:UDP-N-acetylglucosamine/UDP-N-acetylgalactosamine diphosphorylase